MYNQNDPYHKQNSHQKSDLVTEKSQNRKYKFEVE